jgi:hypothetical protein
MRPFQQRTARGGRAPLAQPQLVPEPAGPGNAGWSAAPAGPGPTGHAAKPSACSSRSASRDRAAGAAPSAAATPHHAKQQHKHDHDDQHPQPCRQDSLLGRRRGSWRRRYCRPPEQAIRSRPGDLPGPDRRPRCARARGTLHPATCPSIWAGRVGARPTRQPTTRRPRWARALRAMPSQPSPTLSTSTTREEDPAGGNRPDATTATPTGGVPRGREEFALLGWGNNPSMVVLRRNGRRRGAGAGPMVRAFGETRTCAEDGCTARLSRYNPARSCAIHQGWDQQETTRTRRRRP